MIKDLCDFPLAISMSTLCRSLPRPLR